MPLNRLPKLAILVPAFNEEELIDEALTQLQALLVTLCSDQLIDSNSFIFVVDDGSTDKTWELIKDFKKNNLSIKGIKFSRNFGHQTALVAAYESVVDKSDISVCIDADLQHDISLISDFIKLYNKGYDIVLGVKRERKGDSFFKRLSAKFYYKMLIWMGVNITYNHADFRLLTNRVTKELIKYKEKNLFLRGIIHFLGYKTITVQYDIKERFAGISKYSFRKMVSLAIDGITSFSTTPLRLVSYLGLATIFVSLIEGIDALLAYYEGITSPGWASVIISIYFIGGVQLLSLGIIGEYIGKIYSEVKGRPRYLVSEEL